MTDEQLKNCKHCGKQPVFIRETGCHKDYYCVSVRCECEKNLVIALHWPTHDLDVAEHGVAKAWNTIAWDKSQ